MTGNLTPRAAAWAMVAIPAVILTILGAAYSLTREPAAEVGISWRPGIRTAARLAHERRLGLENGRVVEGRMRYDLLDLRKENIEAIVAEPDIADTDGIDRNAAVLPVTYRYGEGWTWIGRRLPILRRSGVVPMLAAASLVALVIGAERLTRR
jgi:hypothetical protein